MAGRAVLLLSVAVFVAWQQPQPAFQITPEIQTALDRISPDSLRGHLSFIASDALEGRNTPSRGLDLAAEYIASQFRRAGLEPAGDDGYFQNASVLAPRRNMQDVSLMFRNADAAWEIGADKVSLQQDGELVLKDAPVIKADESLTEQQLSGKVVLAEMPDTSQAKYALVRRLIGLKAALVVLVERGAPAVRETSSSMVMDPERAPAAGFAETPTFIAINDARLTALYDSLKAGASAGTMTLHLPAAVPTAVRVRNVIGILRGSDPALRDTYVLVTAHYDHLGIKPDGKPGEDNIFNGANDDGSGTVSVIELASALSAMKSRPKRSLVFMTFYGEEKGLLGSRYYGRHPVFPIDKTVADINLEQVGRTDSSDGPETGTASMTGFDFSDVGTVFKAAGDLTGVKVYRHERYSDPFFARSDNQALADQGVPAHTLCVAYIYPDYHRPGDHWDKIDYQNLARVDRTVALGLLMIADSSRAPQWNESNPQAAAYLKTWKARHENPGNSNQK
jgi:hypothetical protein